MMQLDRDQREGFAKISGALAIAAFIGVGAGFKGSSLRELLVLTILGLMFAFVGAAIRRKP